MLKNLSIISHKNLSKLFTNVIDTFNYITLEKNNCIMVRWMSTNPDKRRTELLAKGLPKIRPINGVKNIILVSSGKGGVGKSTISVNLACALKLIDPGKNVGLLDSDVFGPSIPSMMNLHESPRIDANNQMVPLHNYGVQCMSMGFLVDDKSPVIWRGLMVMQAIDKLLRQVVWDDVEYLVVDTPPGTGDTLLSLVQNLPIAGVVLVTTPQSTAVQVTRRGAMMFRKLSIPIIGIVENMSHVICADCGSSNRIFGDNTEQLAKDLNTTILQRFELNQRICYDQPVVIADRDSLETRDYRNLANIVREFVENRNKL